MCNFLFIDDKTVPKAEDGEEVKVSVKAVYHTDEDGNRTLEVLEVDGNEVQSEEECGCEKDHENLMNEDAQGALQLFMIKLKKDKPRK